MINDKWARSTMMAAGVAFGLSRAVLAAQLEGPATIVYDQFRVPTVVAQTEHDAIFLQGYLHAKNRLFQMDFQRRLFSGRVSELVGSPGLAQDVQLRTLGLRRAAERSLPVQTPEALAWLQAYSDGVNAFLLDTSQPLPIEYGALEITRAGIPLWTPADCLTMAKGLAFGLSFDLGDINRTLALLNMRGVCTAIGCNGLQLYNDDLWRVAPFESATSIPSPPLFAEDTPKAPEDEAYPAYLTDPDFQGLVESYRNQIADIPILKRALESDAGEVGSNWWVVSGANTDSGHPMLTNDPHLSLGAPATFYENHLSVTGGINVTGVSFPGTPGVVIGCNDTICWGATVNGMDVTDVFNEVLVPASPSLPTTPVASIFQGVPQPLQFIPQTFMVNILGDAVPNNQANANVPSGSGGVTLIVPRRNNGPIVQVSYNPASPTPLTGLSVAYTGWSATNEVETLRQFARAASMQDFKNALQFFDVGSQNWSYADVNGNIAYYTSGELPIREDLQTLFFPAGLVHPGLIRDGTNTNRHQWLPLAHPQPTQALSTEILPFAEMPQVENPPSGYILNANNDPAGTTLDNVTWNQFRAGFNGVLYLSAGYASGERLGRIQRLFANLLGGTETLSVSESIAAQANNQLLDAEVLSPYLLAAYANATAPGADPLLQAIVADPRIGDAVGRLSVWDFSTPTGIQEGFDPFDNAMTTPGAPEINASIAASVYSLWRGQMVQRVVDRTLATLPVSLAAYAPGSDQAMSALRKLLDNYATNGGTGASLINFFRVPGVADQNVARDIILLESLRNALNLAASPAFAPAFANSTDLNDYRWGKLHRIVFAHSLGGPFNIPPSGAPAPINPLGAALPGFPRAGGRGAVDASSHDARADGLNEFMFSSGPARRIVATMNPGCPSILEVIPGGESGAPGSPNATDQLALWLVNANKPLPVCLSEVNENAVETVQLVCGNGVVDPGEECDDGNAVNSDGCDDACRIVPVITCLAPSVSAGAQSCTADVACAAIATCVDPRGGAVTTSCAPSGPYALGNTDVTVQCGGTPTSSVAVCSVTVVDTTPPVVTVTTSPALLWPPNHKMTTVNVTVTAVDACDPDPSIVLVSVSSSEPDDAPGGGDGHTTGDVQGAASGTPDFELLLRAERHGGGPGRTYVLVYQATDDSGNAATSTGDVIVPHSIADVVEPLNLVLSGGSATRLDWGYVVGALHYDVVRGDLAALRIDGSDVDLGAVTCIERNSVDANTSGNEDTDVPAPGQAFFYAVQFFDGVQDSSYGSESVGRARVVSGGGCP
jgi:penicillin amidase